MVHGLQGKFEMELKKHTDEAASKVAAVLQRAEEQGHMIESLHTSVSLGGVTYWASFLLLFSFHVTSDFFFFYFRMHIGCNVQKVV